MAQRKQPVSSPKARHGQKSAPSRHDRRDRLGRPNRRRRRTEAASAPLTGTIADLAATMGGLLDARMAFRLPIIIAGAMLAGDRRTAASWFRAAGVHDDWDRYYECLQSVGRSAASKSSFLVVFDSGYAPRELIRPLVARGAVVVTRLRRNAKLFDL